MYSWRSGFQIAAVGAALMLASPAMALTAQQIADNVVAELDNVSDYTASYDLEFADVAWEDETGGSIRWKRTVSGEWKHKILQGSPEDTTFKGDGSGKWNILDPDFPAGTVYQYAGAARAVLNQLDSQLAVRMWYMEDILDDNSWTPTTPATETVNSVSCYKILSGDYKVWVDVATTEKVIRAERYVGSTIKWRVDYTNYSDVESTAQLPATIRLEEFVSGVSDWVATYTLSSIDINASTADSVFTINTPNGL
jgi:hypothetical protein